MLQKDYIIRIVEQIAKVIAKVIFNKSVDNIDEAKRDIEKASENALGVNLQLLLSIPESNMVDLFGLSKDKETGSVKCIMAARLLKCYADLHESENKLQTDLYTKSLNYYLYGLLNIGDSTINKNEIFNEMNEISAKPEIVISKDIELKLKK